MECLLRGNKWYIDNVSLSVTKCYQKIILEPFHDEVNRDNENGCVQNDLIDFSEDTIVISDDSLCTMIDKG